MTTHSRKRPEYGEPTTQQNKRQCTNFSYNSNEVSFMQVLDPYTAVAICSWLVLKDILQLSLACRHLFAASSPYVCSSCCIRPGTVPCGDFRRPYTRLRYGYKWRTTSKYSHL